MPKFNKGDYVKVKKSVKEPKWEWGEDGVNHSSIGVVQKYYSEKSGNFLKVDFPEHKSWSAEETEMELVAKKGQLAPVSRGNITRNTLRLYG